MTVEEVFINISSHMCEGVQFHKQMADYYSFLGLSGYATCHEYHFLQESRSYYELCKYYICHMNRLLPNKMIENNDVIPSSWYRYKRHDVDANTVRTSVRQGLERWVEWESETKKLYEQMYNELLQINEIEIANEINKLIEDVSEELRKAESYQLNKKSADYDMVYIIEEQSKKQD